VKTHLENSFLYLLLFGSLVVGGRSLGNADEEISPIYFGVELAYQSDLYGAYRFSDSVVNSEAGYGLRVAFEFLPIITYGRLGFGSGIGISILENVSLSTGGDASFYALPLNLYVVYRLHLSAKQIFVPYIRGGGGIVFSRQLSRNGNGRPGTQNNWTVDWALGLEICLTPIDADRSEHLDLRYGINSASLIFEYARSSVLEERDPNLTHNAYRLGLRFEI